MLDDLFGKKAASGVRTVVHPGGGFGYEHEVGPMRIDVATGQVTRKLSSVGGLDTVVRPDGSLGYERRVGHLRVNLDDNSADMLL